MRTRSVLRSLLLILVLAFPSRAWAGNTEDSTTTLTIDPSATSGATITAADVNDRSNDASTWANAHVHSLANTTSAGDGAAGDKNLCFDAADTTDMCFRFDDTNNLVTVNSPDANSYGPVAKMSDPAGLLAGAVVYGDGTGALRAGSNQAVDDQALIADSATGSTWRTIANCTDTGGNHLNYTQSTNSFSCGTTAGGGAIAVVNTITSSCSSTGAVTVCSTITQTTGANPVLMLFTGTCNKATAENLIMNFEVDDATQIGSTGPSQDFASGNHMCTLAHLTADLTAASHSFEVTVDSNDANAATVTCGAGASCVFSIVEIFD